MFVVCLQYIYTKEGNFVATKRAIHVYHNQRERQNLEISYVEPRLCIVLLIQ